MNREEFLQVGEEIRAELVGRRFGRVFALSRDAFVIDFHPHAGKYLLIETGQKRRRAHLIRRRLKELERSATNPSPFLLRLKEALSNLSLTAVVSTGSSVELKFESGASIVVALGRRVRNVLLVSAEAVIDAALFQDDNTSHRIGERLSASGEDELTELPTVIPTGEESMSGALDRHYTESESADEFEKLAASAKRKVSSEIAKRRKLLKNLALDIERHGDAETWKRFGDLLLANAAMATRDGDAISVTDFFDAETPQIEIEGDRNKEIPEIAESYFRKYTKARNAAAVIKERIEIIDKEILRLDERLVEVETAIERRDEDYLSVATGEKRKAPESKPKKTDAELKGVRRFISTDGFEILVGKKATDNDYLSFRIAKSNDLWMHAADYPGSHVVVRNPNKKEIPQRTLLEAAELAAFYSSGKKQTKAAVNYTLKKHINKPRRSAPGLVSLSSFKTILVEPRIRLKSES